MQQQEKEKHQLMIDDLSDMVAVYHYFKPGTTTHGIRWAVVHGHTLVSGDYGTWAFDRPFLPTPGGKADRCYMDGKLAAEGGQKATVYDKRATIQDIDEFEQDYKEAYDEGDDEEISEWIGRLRKAAFDEGEYLSVAYKETPMGIEASDVPIRHTRHRWLDKCYDLFDAMCEDLLRVRGKA